MVEKVEEVSAANAPQAAINMPAEALDERAEPPEIASETVEPIRIRVTVNGAEQQWDVAPWTTLLDALREHLGLTDIQTALHHALR